MVHIAGVMMQHISLLSPIKHTNTRQSRQGLGQYLPIIAHTPPQYKRAKPHYFLLYHSPTNYLFTPTFYFRFLFTSASYLPPLFIRFYFRFLFTSSCPTKSQGKIPDRTKKYKVPVKTLLTHTLTHAILKPSRGRQVVPRKGAR